VKVVTQQMQCSPPGGLSLAAALRRSLYRSSICDSVPPVRTALAHREEPTVRYDTDISDIFSHQHRDASHEIQNWNATLARLRTFQLPWEACVVLAYAKLGEVRSPPATAALTRPAVRASTTSARGQAHPCPHRRPAFPAVRLAVARSYLL
jgi:hypothetical protein